MSQTIDRGTLDRLIALGRARGELSPDDLRAALPVEHMEVEALVLMMLELEAAGVSVEPDAFGPPAERPVPASPVLPALDPGTAPPVRRADSAGAAASPAADPGAVPVAPRAPVPDDRATVNRAVALAGAATLLLLGAVLLML
ncbi:RNA polymerase sigma factor region1.1 domain-containing protein [Methylobacterium sp. J-070]|uniref:RNA polymerase sigma factor region1.1 domain-containing protein n=1 Tax=Methylobacterium sp. J-070 TaxID=2836650 RepID=UPI001FB9A8AB|nr:RNA polymerase sigma factor region1.1 domain-containing protein [Methylobacterium sp. J-070]MCJ2052805.1 RNA polymerase sigma factor region1.1 domain-containing protein [Methylobacterium sp. J-070]